MPSQHARTQHRTAEPRNVASRVAFGGFRARSARISTTRVRRGAARSSLTRAPPATQRRLFLVVALSSERPDRPCARAAGAGLAGVHGQGFAPTPRERGPDPIRPDRSKKLARITQVLSRNSILQGAGEPLSIVRRFGTQPDDRQQGDGFDGALRFFGGRALSVSSVASRGCESNARLFTGSPFDAHVLEFDTRRLRRTDRFINRSPFDTHVEYAHAHVGTARATPALRSEASSARSPWMSRPACPSARPPNPPPRSRLPVIPSARRGARPKSLRACAAPRDPAPRRDVTSN
jgi:hypothetical protein